MTIEPFPMVLAGLLTPPPTPARATGAAVTDDDRRHAYTRCLAYLGRLPDAVSGSGGHQATFYAACTIYRFGLSEGEAWAALEWFNATKCQPPWSEGELRHKLADAYKVVAGAGELGSKLTERIDPADDLQAEIFVPAPEGASSTAAPLVTSTSAPTYASPAGMSLEAVLSAHHEAEIGDAKLFSAMYGKRLVFDRSDKTWNTWDGHHWAEDRKGMVVNLVADKVAAQYLHAAAYKRQAGGDDELVNDLIRHGKALRFKNRINNVLALATSNPMFALVGDEWDRDPWVLPVANGVVDLRTGELRPGDPDDYIRTFAPTAWGGLETPAPRWRQFLQEVFDGDEELIAFVQRLYGYGVTGLSVEHVFPVLHGQGRNGKDTLIETISYALGPLASTVSKDALLENFRGGGGSATPHLFALRGLRVAWVSETNEGARLDAGQVKSLTGGGTIVARQLYGKEVRFAPSHLLTLITNHRPHVPADDYALWQRLLLIPFELSFVDDPVAAHERKKDPALKDRLRDEASGILTWLVQGCLEWQRGGLRPPERVKAATQAYQDDEDVIGQFISECCVVQSVFSVRAGDLYAAYVEWCALAGIKELGGMKFGNRVAKRFARVDKTSGRIYVGVGLRSSLPTET